MSKNHFCANLQKDLGLSEPPLILVGDPKNPLLKILLFLHCLKLADQTDKRTIHILSYFITIVHRLPKAYNRLDKAKDYLSSESGLYR